jgi:FG-GAP-like repeat
MKPAQFLVLTCSLLFATFPRSALANHRTGSSILPGLIAAGDFNQDGNLDLAVNSEGFDHIAILIGDGNGDFTLAGHFSTDTLPKGLQVGDVNGDGYLDVVSCTSWGYDDIVLLGDGTGAFHAVSPPNEIDGEGEPVRCLLRDFNKDGRLDLAVSAPDDDKIQIYFGDGKGNFSAPPTGVEGVPNSFGMASGDLNGDGNLDMAIVCPSKPPGTAQIAVLLGDGSGNFSVSSVPMRGQPVSVQVGDMNGDGKLDLVVAGAVAGNSSGNFILTFLGDGTGQFSLEQTVPLGSGSLKGDIALGDFNEDGNLDVAFPQSSLQIPGKRGTKVLIFFGDGTGDLTAGPVLTVGQEPHTVIAVDLNHDGHLDLAVSNRTDGTVSALLGDGLGNFTVSSTTSILSQSP